MGPAKPICVEPRAKFHIWIEYDDGASGELDLSALAGRGVFAAWLDREYFERVSVAAHGAVVWGEGELDLCPDALYLELTGRTVDEVMPELVGRSRRRLSLPSFPRRRESRLVARG